MLGNTRLVQQRHARVDRTGGEVLGQLGAHGRVDDDPGRGDRLLGLTADVGGIPRRSSGAEPNQDGLHRGVAVELTHPGCAEDHRQARLARIGGGVAVAEVAKLLVPGRHELGAILGCDLVGAGVLPGPPVPRPAHRRAGFLARVRGAPFGLVPVDVAADLRGPLTERTHEGRQLGDLPGRRVEGEPGRGQCGPELRVAHHRGVPDPVQRLDGVTEPDRVQAPPRPLANTRALTCRCR